jgi:hypothetical protein
VADFNMKIGTNLQNNYMEAENEADGTSDYESTPRLLERRTSILFLQKYDFYYRSFFLFTYSSYIEVHMYLMQKFLS